MSGAIGHLRFFFPQLMQSQLQPLSQVCIGREGLIPQQISRGEGWDGQGSTDKCIENWQPLARPGCSTGSTSIIFHHCCVPKGVPSSSVGISPLAHMLHISGTWSAMIGQDSELLLGLKQPQVLMLLHSTGSSSFYCTRQQRVCTP